MELLLSAPQAGVVGRTIAFYLPSCTRASLHRKESSSEEGQLGQGRLHADATQTKTGDRTSAERETERDGETETEGQTGDWGHFSHLKSYCVCNRKCINT